MTTNIDRFRQEIMAVSFNDDATRAAIGELISKYNYLADPHGAVAFLGAKHYLEEIENKTNCVFLETAHPAKFIDVVSEVVEKTSGQKAIEIPATLKECLEREKQSIKVSSSFQDFKEILLGL